MHINAMSWSYLLYIATWGTLKSTKIDKIHKIHTPKFQGRVFSEVAEAPQAAATRRTLVGDPETGKQGIFSKMSNFQNSKIEMLEYV